MATPPAACQEKSRSQSLMFMSQECGLKLGFSCGLRKLEGRGCEVSGVREACHGPASPPRDGEGLSGVVG